MHQNTRMTLWFYGLAGFAGALADTVSSNLLFALTGDNLQIGLNEGMQGLVQLFVALPAGRYADTHGDRQPQIVRLSALVGVIANLCLMLVLVAILLQFQSAQLQFWAIATVLALSGVAVGLYDPALEALWSNTLANGEERTKFNSTRATVSLVASLVGPGTSLLVFTASDTGWNLPTMCFVWLLGALCACVSFLPLTRLRSATPPPAAFDATLGGGARRDGELDSQVLSD
jgi:MFS family permease